MEPLEQQRDEQTSAINAKQLAEHTDQNNASHQEAKIESKTTTTTKSSR